MISENGVRDEGFRAAGLWLAALILLHIVFAALFAASTPYRTAGVVRINPSVERDIGAPDERQHANYIGRLLRGEGIPVFDPKDPNLYENYQAHQPPLFYGISTVWSKVTGVGGVEARDDGLKLRALNVAIGAVGVAGVFFFAWWGFRNPVAAVSATAFAALLPMNVALSGAISNDPLLIALSTWALAWMARAIREGWTMRSAAIVAVLIGLAMLTKTTALALLPAALVAVLAPQRQRPKWAHVGAAAGIVLALALPWWIRNQGLYGDPFAIRAFTDAFGGSAQKSMLVEQVIPQTNPGADPNQAYWLNWVLFWTARSFVGVFGYMDIWLTPSGLQDPSSDANRLYFIAFLFIGIAFIGYLISLRANGESEGSGAKGVHLLGWVFFAVVTLLFLRFNNQYFQAQARYLLPALAPISAGFGLGLATLFTKRPLFAAVLPVLMFGGIDLFAWSRLESQFESRIELAKQMSPPE